MAKKAPEKKDDLPPPTARASTTSVQREADQQRTAERDAQPPAEPAKRLKVEALETGYYDHARRRVGDVFYIDASGPVHPEGHRDAGMPKCFSSRWMKLADPDAALKVTGPNEALRKQHDDILPTKNDANRPQTATSDDYPLDAD